MGYYKIRNLGDGSFAVVLDKHALEAEGIVEDGELTSEYLVREDYDPDDGTFLIDLPETEVQERSRRIAPKAD